MMNLAGFVGNSSIDYPSKRSAVLYLWGCDFRCPFCNLKEIILDENTCQKVEIGQIVNKLNESFMIDAVTITGGEPLLQEETIRLIAYIKRSTPLAIKLDTNGSFPERLEKAIPGLNFISIDIKAPFEKYSAAVGADFDVEKLKRSLDMLKTARLFREARTTIVPGLNDTEDDILAIAKIVIENKLDMYTIQQFIPQNTIDPAYEGKEKPDYERMRNLGRIIKERYPGLKVRTATSEHGFEYVG